MRLQASLGNVGRADRSGHCSHLIQGGPQQGLAGRLEVASQWHGCANSVIGTPFTMTMQACPHARMAAVVGHVRIVCSWRSAVLAPSATAPSSGPAPVMHAGPSPNKPAIRSARGITTGYNAGSLRL